MVDFDNRFRLRSPSSAAQPALDHGIGQQNTVDRLAPPQLLSLITLKPPGSPARDVAIGDLRAEIHGPVYTSESDREYGPIFAVRIFDASHRIGSILIRLNTGAFGVHGLLPGDSMPRLIEAVEAALLHSALKRTTHFVAEHILSAPQDPEAEAQLAHVGIDLEHLRLSMYETGCLDIGQVRQQQRALMATLVQDRLTGCLISALGGRMSIITNIHSPLQRDQLLRCASDAYLVARSGLVDASPASLTQLLQDKTVLALVGEAVQKLCRWNPLNAWAEFLPRN